MVKKLIKRICSLLDLTYIVIFALLLYFHFMKMLLLIIIPALLYYIVNQLISFIHGNRLNKLYTYIYHKKSDEYELQYNPPFGFHWINKFTFLDLRRDAINQLNEQFNYPLIVGITMTLNRINDKDNYQLLFTYGVLKRLLLIPQNSMALSLISETS